MNSCLRKLTPIEIKKLITNGCSSENWEKVKVKSPFHPSHFKQVVFAGHITIGLTDKIIQLQQSDGQSMNYKSGITNSHLHNTIIGDNCHLKNVKHLSGVVIGKECALVNIDYFANKEKSAFGNGVEIKPLIETGGRTLPLWVGYNANLVDLLLFHPKRDELKKKVLKEINESDPVTKHLGDHSLVSNGQKLEDIVIGDHAILENVTYLKNSTVMSTQKNQTIIANDVIGKNIIIKENVVVQNGVLLENCFIAERSKICNQASIKHSFLFSNNDIEHSEIVSCILGHHTVSHHKSSLLIGGKFSFYNAGSGCNMSNHKYRLGPLHQGILERGCKSGSGAYLLFPSHFGAYTTIIGRHPSHLNTVCLPFSLLYEDGKKSVLDPGFNIGRIGLYRDIKKWEERIEQKRGESDYHISAFNPYTLSEAIKGHQLLSRLLKDSNTPFNLKLGFYLNSDLIKKGINRYQMLFRYVYYDACYQALKNGWMGFADLNKKGKSNDNHTWIDMGGMIIPLKKVNDLVTKSPNLNQLKHEIKKYFLSSQKFFCLWAIDHLKDHQAIHPFKTKAELFDLYQKSSLDHLNEILKDSQKEFTKEMQIGYGLYGTSVEDFNNCHGQWEFNHYVMKLKKEIEKVKTSL